LTGLDSASDGLIGLGNSLGLVKTAGDLSYLRRSTGIYRGSRRIPSRHIDASLDVGKAQGSLAGGW